MRCTRRADWGGVHEDAGALLALLAVRMFRAGVDSVELFLTLLAERCVVLNTRTAQQNPFDRCGCGFVDAANDASVVIRSLSRARVVTLVDAGRRGVRGIGTLWASRQGHTESIRKAITVRVGLAHDL